MDLRLGFFADFKETNSVLLEGSPSGIERLASALGEFVASKQELMPIHSLAWVAPHHPVRLVAIQAPHPLAGCEQPLFTWQVQSTELPAIQESLRQLAHSSVGHQYFDLAGSTAKLIVSVGEYGESWWNTHG